MKLKRILPNKSLRNSFLRQRTDLSPLLKTYVHRYHNDSDTKFNKWYFHVITQRQRDKIKDYYLSHC